MTYEWVANPGSFSSHIRPTDATNGYALCGALLPLDASHQPPPNTGRVCSECASAFAIRTLLISTEASLLTHLGTTDDGAIIVGPMGWSRLQAAIARYA